MAYVSVTIEGGIFPADLLDQLASGQGDGQRAEDFGLGKGARLSDEMQSAFSDIRSRWDAFQRRLTRSHESLTTLTRSDWVIPFLEVLGFDLVYQRASVRAGGESYPISHRAGDDSDAPPVHIVSLDQELGKKTAGSRFSPHALVQEYLNRSDALWGIVTNGERLRLLRDSARLSRPTYLEFDLRGMIDGNLYSEFTLLYRLLHHTRFPRGGADAHECRLERYYQQGIDEGDRVRDHLRDGVELALQELGTAFLIHPESEPLRAALRDGPLGAADYYRQLLRLVYRLLFLFVAEERKLIFPPEAERTNFQAIYTEYYSLTRLRERCERHFAGDHYSDLWPGLLQTFWLFRDADTAQKLGLSALDSELFGNKACEDIELAGCENRHLLRAIFHLSTFKVDQGIRRRVNYAALDVEELGSVYESLLEYNPRVTLDGIPRFELVPGSERKQTSSYYTPPDLVRELIESALVPVIEERLAAAKTLEAKEQGLLGLRVCDPASGSGHFLLAAARRIGHELARVRSGEAEPSPEEYRAALRDVIRHCIYAVDKNPLAVDLCKVALWIEGHNAGLPLSFLDHHIKCGDSLVGVFDLDVLQQGIPDSAYKTVTGDDTKAAAYYKKRNKQEIPGNQRSMTFDDPGLEPSIAEFAPEFATLAVLEERTPGDVQAKEALYQSLRNRGTTWWQYKIACDLWTAAFFVPPQLPEHGRPDLVPTTNTVREFLRQPKAVNAQLVGRAVGVSQTHPFFHWPLEFPDVFAVGGFDVLLGNPPWDTLSPDAKEFFSAFDASVRFLEPKAQKALISRLRKNPAINDRWEEYCRAIYADVKFIKTSGRYHLFAPGDLGKGDFNVYRMFVELALRLTREKGRFGQVVPEGFYNGANAMAIRKAFFETTELDLIVGFENARHVWFPGADSRLKFCLYATRKGSFTECFNTAFNTRTPEALAKVRAGKTISIPVSLVTEFAPDALAIMEFESQRDIDIAATMYDRWPKFGDETVGEPIRHYMREIDMGNDRDLFTEDPQGIPVYEGRMINQFDYRAKGYRGGRGRASTWTKLRFGDPEKSIQPQWYVPRDRIPTKVKGRVRKYRIGFADVTSPTNERSLIAALIPPNCICGHKVPTITFKAEYEWAYLAWLAVANSVVMDFLARKKVSLSMSYTILDSLPFPRFQVEDPRMAKVVPLALRLTCVGPGMTAFWNTMADYGWVHHVPADSMAPGLTDEENRFVARAELDAFVAHDVFGLNRDELAYILDTFSVLQRRDVRAHGEYRTKRVILEIYDEMAEAVRTGVAYRTRLDPPPADPREAHPAREAASASAVSGKALEP